MLNAATAQTLREIVAKSAMPPLALVVDDCRAAYEMIASTVSLSAVSRFGGRPRGGCLKTVE